MSIDLHWRNFLNDKNDTFSFSIIYNEYVDTLYSYGISLGYSKHLCKDAIQDVFYKLYTSKDSLRHIHNIAAYIFKSYKHRLIDLAKKQKLNDHVTTNEETFSIEVTALDDIIETEDTEKLKQKVAILLNSLSPHQREVIYMRYMLDLSYDEIAEVLNITSESVRKLVYRTMEKLRRQFGSNECALSIFMIAFNLNC